MTDQNPREAIGGNNPPLGRLISTEGGEFAGVVTAFLEEEYAQWPEKVRALLAEATTLMRDPETGALRDIADDAMKTQVVGLIRRFRDASKTLEGFHGKEKTPYLDGGRAVDSFFFGLIDQCLRRDRKAKPGAADVLNAKLTDYDTRKLAEEQAARDRAAAEARRVAEEAEAARRKAEEEAEAARLAAERARKPEQQQAKAEVADTAERQADAAKVEATVTAGKAVETHIATLARPADIMRTRHEGGITSTVATETYAEITDRDLLDKAKLWPLLSLDAIQKAVNAYAKATDWKTPMAGASIGRRPKSRVL